MLCENYSSRRRLRETCCSLLTIAIGVISFSIIVALVYDTYQTTAGNISYCSHWTDIAGRLALFLTFYYAAGICGALPIPECFRVNWLPPPFILYRLESWRNLLVNVCLFFTPNYQGYEPIVNDPEMSPPRDEYNEPNFNCSPTPTFHEKSQSIQISETDTPKQSIVQSNGAARYSDTEHSSSSEDTSMSFDSSVDGLVFPLMKSKACKPRYISSSSISTSESTEKSLSVDASSDKFYEVSETLNDRSQAVAALCGETDTPPRTPEIELLLPSYPRYPWSYLRNGSYVPYEAKALHKRNLMTERQEISEHNKRQKEETPCSPKDSEQSRIRDSDQFSPCANRPRRPPLIPAKTKTGFRCRTISAPRSIQNSMKMNTRIRNRLCLSSPPFRYRPYSTQMSPKSEDDSDTGENKSCGKSTDFHAKVEHIQKSSLKFDPSFQTGASTSRQSIDFPRNTSNSDTDAEASISRQNIEIFPSKISNSNLDAEALPSRQRIDVFSSNTSNSNIDGEASTSRQNIEIFPRKISNSNLDAEALPSRQRIHVLPSNNSNSKTDGEASTSRQNIDAFSSNNSDSNVDAQASASRQNTDVFSLKTSDSNPGGETQTSKQDTDNFLSKISAADEASTSKQNIDPRKIPDRNSE